MRIAIFTSNAIRHKYLANTVCANTNDECIVVSELVPLANTSTNGVSISPLITEHFALRNSTEAKYFSGHDLFQKPTLPLIYKEINLTYAYTVIKNFAPELIIVFGSSIIREPLLSILPYGGMINLHLGLSPYYRGSGTNFWPFINDEIGYIGSSLLYINKGIDTGDIVAHVRPIIELGDNVHTIGCKVIQASAYQLIQIMRAMKKGLQPKAYQQWSVKEHYYRTNDFTEKALKEYYEKLEAGVVKKFVANPQVPPKLINLKY